MIGKILHGWLYWRKIKIQYGIDYNKVVVVLSNENHELDRQVLVHLPDFVQRKHAGSVIVLCKEEYQKEWTAIWENDLLTVSVRKMSDEKMKLLYSYYCFVKFFDNIVFTYTDTPRDNQLGIYLRKTDVNEEDAACLALYHLRCVPSVRR